MGRRNKRGEIIGNERTDTLKATMLLTLIIIKIWIGRKDRKSDG